MEKEKTEEVVQNPEVDETAAPEKTPAKKSLLRRILKIAGIVLVILIVLGFVRDYIIKLSVEKAGSYIIGTPVTMKHFRASVFGNVHIKGFSVGNPQGYNHPNAFELGEVEIDLNILSLLTDKIEINKIYVEGVNVDYELKLGTSNLGEIQKNLERFAPRGDGAKEPEPAEEKEEDSAEDESAQKQIVIRKLDVSNCSLSFSNSTLGTTVKLPLVPLHQENIGDGKPIGETVYEIFGLAFTAVADTVSGAGKVIGDAASNAGKALGDAASDAGKALNDAAGNAGKALEGAASDAGKAFNDAASNASKALKGLFK